MQIFQYIALLLHILAAMIWIGGMVFLGVVLIPVVRDPLMRAHAGYLIQRTGRRFRNLGWACLLILATTGVINLERWSIGSDQLASNAFWHSSWGRLLAIKLALVGATLTLSLIHDFVVGPRASARLREARDSVEAQRLRWIASWMGRLNLLIGVGIVALAIMLVRGVPA